MKISHVLFIILLSVTAASAQTRPRIYEGSETVGAIQVKYILPQAEVEIGTDAVVESIATASSNHYLPSPMVCNDYDKTVPYGRLSRAKSLFKRLRWLHRASAMETRNANRRLLPPTPG